MAEDRAGRDDQRLEDYTSFAGKSEDASGSVKFIYKTGETVALRMSPPRPPPMCRKATSSPACGSGS